MIFFISAKDFLLYGDKPCRLKIIGSLTNSATGLRPWHFSGFIDLN